MAIASKVGKATNPHNDGYHIGTVWDPTAGFGGRFVVTIEDRMDAADVPEPLGTVTPPSGGLARLDVQLYDGERAYSFQGITERSVGCGADYTSRVRRQTFCYSHNPGAVTNVPVVLTHRGEVTPRPGPAGGDYEFGIGSFPQYPIGFRSLITPGAPAVFEWLAVRNRHQSFLESLLKVNNAMANGAPMTPLVIHFAQGNVTLDPGTVVRLFTEESYGSLLQARRVPLEAYLDGARGLDLVAPGSSPASAADALAAWVENRRVTSALTHTVERLVAVVAPGTHDHIKIR